MYGMRTHQVFVSPPRRARSLRSNWDWHDLPLHTGLGGAAHYQSSRPYPLAAARYGALMDDPSKLGRVPSQPGSPASSGGGGRGAQRRHVLYECNGFARYGSLLRGVGRRTRDWRELRAHELILHVPPHSKGSSWTGCSPLANQARYAMDVHLGP